MGNTLDEIFAEHNEPKAFAAAYADHLARILRELDFDRVAEFTEVVLKARRTHP